MEESFWYYHCNSNPLEDSRCVGERFWIDVGPAFFWKYRYVFAACAILYIPLWKGIQNQMRDRAPLGKTYPAMFKHGLFLWNVLLSVLSWACFYNIGMVVARTRATVGHMPVCHLSDHWLVAEPRQRDEAFWGAVFLASKVPEMMDTIFLVLNKREVITLHWWHHLTVMVYAWSSALTYPDGGDGIVFSLVNSGVHSLMYPYYALAVKFSFVRVKPLRMSITMIQILQMVLGIALRAYSTAYCSPLYPERTDWVGPMGWAMYGSYLVLFVKFFIDQYILQKGKRKDQ